MIVKGALPLGVRVRYVIYRHPLDYPDKYVVRRWLNSGRSPTYYPEEQIFAVEDTAEAARARVPRGEGYRKVPRHPSWDPVILEAWMIPQV